jgi:hypothetical protein
MASETLVTGGTAVSRQNRLADRVASLRTRASTGSLDRWLLWIGGILLPLGFMLVFLGWWGTSHTVFVFEQLPYVVSGGLLGLAFVFAGGFVYFAYWQTVIVRELRTERREVVSALRRIQSTLDGQGGVAANATQSASATVAPTGAFVATPTGTMFHRPDCPVVARREDVRDIDAGQTELLPCGICDPLGETSGEVLER